MFKLKNDPFTGFVCGVFRIADNAFIPFDPANTDFSEYLKWLAEGKQPLPPDEPTLSETV